MGESKFVTFVCVCILVSIFYLRPMIVSAKQIFFGHNKKSTGEIIDGNNSSCSYDVNDNGDDDDYFL